MSASSYRRSTCRLCESPDLQQVLSLGAVPPVDAYVPADRLDQPQERFPVDLFLCLNCGHVQLLDVVSPELLFGDYIYETASSPGLVEHFRRYAEEVWQGLSLTHGALVVDVGSNDGTLLRFFKARGARVLGIDPAREIARRATTGGIETLPSFLTPDLAWSVRQKYGPAALVTANNVFAHADDLGAMADAVRLMLAPDGVFVCEVSYILDMIDGMVFDFIYHEHLSEHSVKPFRTFLARHGMELIDIERVPTKGGSLRCYARLIGGSRAVGPRVAEMLELEAARGLDRPEVFAAWAFRIEQVKAEVVAYVARAKAAGQSVAAYGASATSTVLIYYFGLGEALDFIVDDIPERQNRFSPGYHIPVVSSDALYSRKPDSTLILAWRFADMIMRKHERYLDQGGTFVIPLPDVRLVTPSTGLARAPVVAS